MIRRTRIPAIECRCEAIKKDGSPCLHRWYSISKKLPAFCPNRECRSREWNGKKAKRIRTKIELPKPAKMRVQDDENEDF